MLSLSPLSLNMLQQIAWTKLLISGRLSKGNEMAITAVMNITGVLDKHVGEQLLLHVTPVGTVPFAFQWAKGGTPIPGLTGDTLDIPHLALADAADYTCNISDAAGDHLVTPSVTVHVTVMPLPTPLALTIAPVAGTITKNVGDPFQVTATATGGIAPYVFEAKRGATVVPMTGNVLSIANLTAGEAGQYTVSVKDSAVPPTQVTSAVIDLHVNAATATAARPIPWWVWVPLIIGVAILLGIALQPLGQKMADLVVPVSPTPTVAPTTQQITPTPGFHAEPGFTGAPTEAPTTAATQAPTTAAPAANSGSSNVSTSIGDGKALAESLLGKTLPWPPDKYVAGKPGFPTTCAGLCWDLSKLAQGIMVHYGPNLGEEDITESPSNFGDGSTGPLELMTSGKVTKVIFANAVDAQLEMCAIGTLDGKPLTEVLGVAQGECGKRVALPAGWHVIEDNANSPVAGFGVRFTATAWASMSEDQIVKYNSYWSVSGDTATWKGPDGVEILMPPALVSMMQDFGTLKKVVFTTSTEGQILFCNGSVSGPANFDSKDGACHQYTVPAGTYTYSGEQRLSAGISWEPAK